MPTQREMTKAEMTRKRDKFLRQRAAIQFDLHHSHLRTPDVARSHLARAADALNAAAIELEDVMARMK